MPLGLRIRSSLLRLLWPPSRPNPKRAASCIWPLRSLIAPATLKPKCGTTCPTTLTSSIRTISSKCGALSTSSTVASSLRCTSSAPWRTRKLSQTAAGFIESFQNPHLKALIKAFMDDPQIEYAYKTAPAAKSLHHAYLGGLLDHVVSLFRLCDLACRNYPVMIDRDLLLAGAFLHDIGKVHELAFSRTFAYTTRGQLLGHMIIELEMLHEKVAQVQGFPADLKTLLEHLIISHHGKYEFGSPKMPMFPEALMLHYLDDLDSKMESMRSHFEREPDSEWTSYNPSLERPLLNTQKFLEKLRAGESPSTAAAAASGSDENT